MSFVGSLSKFVRKNLVLNAVLGSFTTSFIQTYLRPPFLLYWSVKLAFLSKLRSWRRHSLTIWTRTPPSKSQFLNLGKPLKWFKGYFLQDILSNILLNLFCVPQFSSSERYWHFKWDLLKTNCNEWWRRVKKIVMFYRQFTILVKRS